MVNKIAVDWPFSIPRPLPSFPNCRNRVTTIPEIAETKAAVVLGRLENKPKSKGAVKETDIRE